MRARVGASLLFISNGILLSTANEANPFGKLYVVDEQSDPPTSRRLQLSIDDVTSVLITEAHTKFGAHRMLKDESNQSWNTAIDTEWSRARELERTAQKNVGALRRRTTSVPDGTFPYLVCDIEPGKLGERCRDTVEEHFGSLLVVSDDYLAEN